MKISRSVTRRPFPSLTPLVDMVFQLLIFFMLTSVAKKPDLFPVHLPESATASKQAAQPAVILVSADGKLALNAEPLRFDDIGAKLSGAASVMVKADGKAKSGLIVRVLERVNRAGIQNVILATNRLQTRFGQ